MSYSLCGDLAEAQGEFDRAATCYEAAAGRVQAPLRQWFALLRVLRIMLEQRRPRDLLELGRRNNTPWAAGVRGTAWLLLHKNADAEKEFAALRDSIAPVLGDYVANGVIEFHRLQAAAYAGRFDEVIRIWPRLPRSFWTLYSLDVGRAYLQSGVFAEAEHHLRLAWTAQRAFFMNSDMQDQHDSLTWMLAQFYLGQLHEKTGREGEAVVNYQAFLNHFEDSSVPLPQLTSARTLAARFRPSEPGELLFSDEFLGDAFAPGWTGDPKAWQVTDGVARVTEPPEEGNAGMRRHAVRFHDAIFELSFRFESARHIALTLRNESGPALELLFLPDRITLRSGKGRSPNQTSQGRIAILYTDIAPGGWHKLRVDIRGSRVIAQIDESLPKTMAVVSPQLDVDKTGFGLSTDGSASFDYVRVYRIKQGNPNLRKPSALALTSPESPTLSPSR